MILAIETATEICSVALVHQHATRSSRSLNEKNIHSERLMSLVDEVLTESAAGKQEIDAIAVSIGPGSFTGLRIGLSTAKGLAYALEIPIIAVPTLDGIAESFRSTVKEGNTHSFCAMIDAKRNEAFYAFYSISQEKIRKESEYSICTKEEIINEAKKRQSVMVQSLPSAISVGMLGERRRKEYEVSDFSRLEPLYLREFVATLPKK